MDCKAKITCLKASRKLIEAVMRSSFDELYFSSRLETVSLELLSMIRSLESRFYSDDVNNEK